MSTFANHPVSPAKAAVVEEMKEKMQSAQGAVFVGFTGLTVADVTKLRRKFREGGVDYKVIKNTLTRIAADELGYHALDAVLEGPTAIAYSTEDAVAPAKILKEFIKETKTEALSVKAGIVDGQVIDAAAVDALSTYSRAIFATWFMCLTLYALRKQNKKLLNLAYYN